MYLAAHRWVLSTPVFLEPRVGLMGQLLATPGRRWFCLSVICDLFWEIHISFALITNQNNLHSLLLLWIQVAEWKFDQLDTDRDGVLKKKELKVSLTMTKEKFFLLKILKIDQINKVNITKKKLNEDNSKP